MVRAMKAREWVRSNGKVMFMGGLLLATPPYRCTGTEGGGGSGGTASAGTSSTAGTAGSGASNSGGADASAGSGGTAGTETGGTAAGGSTAGTETGGTETGGTAAGGTTAGTETGGSAAGGTETGGTETGGTAAGGTTAGTETGGTAGTETGGTAAAGGVAGSGGSGGAVHGTGYDTSLPGLVKDNQIGIVWQQLDDGSYPSFDWDNADNHCRDLEYAGFSDWRLPSAYELFTLVQLESGSSNHHNLTVFPNSPADYYWTGTPMTFFGPGWYNIVWFGSYESSVFGGAPQSLAADPSYFEHPVRCVRGGDAPAPRFTEYGDGTALDNLTGLVWEMPLTFDLSLAQASERCSNLGGGWRLPALVELLGAVSSLEAPLENSSWDAVPLWTSSSYVEAPHGQQGVYVLYEGDDPLPQVYYGWEVPLVAKSRCVR